MKGAWPLSHVELKVLDLERTKAFYRRLGLVEIQQSRSMAALGAGDRVLLVLRQLVAGRPRSPQASGLYHLALLVPDEADLAAFAAFTLSEGVAITSASDHLVSQAIYLNDPEGNGIEVYADRPKQFWRRQGNWIEMDSIPLDTDRLASQATRRWVGFRRGTLLGHVHLNVADLDRSSGWYERLGLAITAEIPGARFMSWDGYHHHLAMNTWSGASAHGIEVNEAGIGAWALTGTDMEGVDPNGLRVLAASSHASR